MKNNMVMVVVWYCEDGDFTGWALNRTIARGHGSN